MEVSDIVQVFGILFLIIGCFFGIITLILFKSNKKTQSWGIARGKILESKLEEIIEVYAHDTDEFNNTNSTTYNSKIKYSYSYKGKDYESSKVYPLSLSKLILRDSTKKKNIKNNPVGKQVQVFVNPIDPSKSALINQIPIVGSVLFSTIFVSIGIFIILFKTSLYKFF